MMAVGGGAPGGFALVETAYVVDRRDNTGAGAAKLLVAMSIGGMFLQW